MILHRLYGRSAVTTASTPRKSPVLCATSAVCKANMVSPDLGAGIWPAAAVPLDSPPALEHIGNMGTRRIMKLTRQRTLENAGSRTLFFTTAHIGRRRHSDFFSPSQVPEFEGESAWFEAEQVPKLGWRILRRVTEHGQAYEAETTDGAPPV